ncbi:hypothetical protein FB451DRAFT_221433 [Mycena latifolia]|nr:hypothetical protein FB451DRAFT_221433 [Mycena latifolia]
MFFRHHDLLSQMLSLLFFSYLHSALAKLVTTIIDDAFPGDTHSSVSYSPSDAWGIGSATGHGRIMPDASHAQDSTWHDTTDDTSLDHDGTTPTFMDINFQGIGIDVRCIIPNNKADPSSIPPFTGTKSNYSFFVDNVPQNRDFTHEAGTTGDAFFYNTSVYSTTGLPNGPHTLKLLLNGGPGVDGSVLLLFDYAIVTSDDGTGDSGSEISPIPSSTTSTTTGSITSAPSTTSTNASVKSNPSSLSESTTVAPVDSTTITDSFIPTGPTSATPTSATPAQSAPTHSSSSSAMPSAVHKSDIGAIIGGLGGGLLTLVLLLFFLFRLRRRRPHRFPKILPFPNANLHYSRPPSLLRAVTAKKTDPKSPSSSPPHKDNPNQPAQTASPHSVGVSAQSSSNSAMREYVRTLRAEVERLREQQREMVATQSISPPEPPPRYEET